MKLIITGALGHIGSYLISQLEKQSIKFDKIILIQLNFSEILITLIYQVLYILNLPRACKIFKFGNILNNNDIVIHLAAITNAAESFYNSDQVEKIILIQQKVADLCYEKIKVIHISSTSYGTQKIL